MIIYEVKLTIHMPHHIKKLYKNHLCLFISIAAGITLVIIALIGYKLYIAHNTMKPVVESAKTDMKKLPPEMKKQLSFASPSATFRVPILMYHYVEYVQDKRDIIRQSLNINPDVFESQIKTLADAGYTFMTAKELGEVLDGKQELPLKPILITIDDVHWDVDTVILPILKQYHAKATAYVITGFTGGSDFMTEEQIQDVIKSGLIEIGAHTVHHIGLKGILLKTVRYEVEESKKMLENTYHIFVSSFAYPSGYFDLQAIQVVKDAGFSTSVSTIPGVEANQANRFFLYRLRPGRRTGQIFLDWLTAHS